MDSKFKIVKDRKELKELISFIKVTGYASLDFETNGTNPRDPAFIPTVIGISFQIGSAWVVPLAHKDSPFREEWKEILGIIGKEVWENPSILKIVWNAIFETKVFLHYGYSVRGRLLDGILAKHLLDENRPHGLKEMVNRFLPDFAGYEEPVKLGKKAKAEEARLVWENIPLETLSEYCALDCDSTFRLALHFENRLMDLGLYHLLRNLYMPMSRILAETNYHGVLVDRTYLTWLKGFFEREINKKEKQLFEIPVIRDFNEYYIENKIQQYIDDLQDEIDYNDLTDRQIEAREEKISRIEAGEPVTKAEQKLFEPINFGSTKQLIELLYESEEGFEFPILERSKTGNPSTAESTLLKLKEYDTSGFINTLLELRSLNKLLSSFVNGVLQEHLTWEDRIHPSFLLFGTASGRTSSRNINFQQIPRDKGDESYDSYIKKMFIAPKDKLFTESDGSQMELRVAAELSRDDNMINIFKEGKNIHVQTASDIFNIPYAEIQEARKNPDHPKHTEMVAKHKAAKVLNFTIFYGAGPAKVSEFLSEVTGNYHSKQEAEELIERWFEAFPGARKWMDKTLKKAKRLGYVENAFGFRRRFPILLENPKYLQGIDRSKYSEAERASVNSIIQGSAAMLTFWVIICIYEARLKGEFPRDMYMVSTVHDSIEFYLNKTHAKEYLRKIEEIAKELPGMKEYLGFEMRRVPMKFSSEMGITWGHKEEFDEDCNCEEFYKKQWESYNKEPYPHIKYS